MDWKHNRNGYRLTIDGLMIDVFRNSKISSFWLLNCFTLGTIEIFRNKDLHSKDIESAKGEAIGEVFLLMSQLSKEAISAVELLRKHIDTT